MQMLYKWQSYIIKAFTNPPAVTWRKARRKVGDKLKYLLERWRAYQGNAEISNDEFYDALCPEISPSAGSDTIRYGDIQGKAGFFISPSHREQFVDALRKCSPKAEARIVAAADRVGEHIFDLLGSGPTPLGKQIDWHVDFKIGHRFNPRQYYADIRPAPYPGGYDIKVPWELSRCQHFAWLGQAYWLTGDEKYAQEFVAQATDWIECNPNKFGVNWACTMDVAIRVVNWLWGYYFFKDSLLVTDEFLLTFFKSLLAHGRHIIDNLEWSETLTSNHYLSNVVGLVYLGILLPGFKEAQYWREFGLQELEKEMFKQVYPDGVDFEASTAYHRLVTELFLSATLLARLNGYHFSTAYMDRLEKMLEFILYATKPDGAMPLIGDNDNGRLHRLKIWRPPEREWVDYRYLLAIGAVLFGRDDFAQAAGDQWEEAIWFWGERALIYRQNVESKRLPPLQLESRSFPDAGWYIMRHQDMYMFISAGPNGQGGNGGHAHNDKLSFELYANGQTWIVDPGTYVYTPDYETRNLFRSTAYHNTVRIDGQELNRFIEGQLFTLKDESQLTVNVWETNADYDLLDITQHCYQRLSHPVEHCRRFFFDKQEKLWLIEDIFSGEGQHLFEWFWHFQPLVSIDKQDDGLLATNQTQTALQIHFFSIDMDGVFLQQDWAAFGYGTKIESSTVYYTKTAQVPLSLMIALVPIKTIDKDDVIPRLERAKKRLEQKLCRNNRKVYSEK